MYLCKQNGETNMAEMLFKPVPQTLRELMCEVDNGKLGLPEITERLCLEYRKSP